MAKLPESARDDLAGQRCAFFSDNTAGHAVREANSHCQLARRLYCGKFTRQRAVADGCQPRQAHAFGGPKTNHACLNNHVID